MFACAQQVQSTIKLSKRWLTCHMTYYQYRYRRGCIPLVFVFTHRGQFPGDAYGGSEGLQQKAWTLEVEGHHWLAAWSECLVIRLYGGGDDQKIGMIGLIIPHGMSVEDSIEHRKQDINARMARRL